MNAKREAADISAMTDTAQLRRDEVYAQLREDILSCALPPGVELYEGELAERFDMSKSPIRDALSRLHQERLVTVEPRRGYRVAPVSLAAAADLFEFRRLLESSCARLTAASCPDDDLAGLDGFRRFDPAEGQESFDLYNRRFHLALAALCPNRRMAETTRGLIEEFDRLVLMSVVATRNQKLGVLLAEHNAIIDAVQSRDGRGAARLLAQHVQRAERRVMTALGNAAIVA